VAEVLSRAEALSRVEAPPVVVGARSRPLIVTPRVGFGLVYFASRSRTGGAASAHVEQER
jgi:hypothetical protein